MKRILARVDLEIVKRLGHAKGFVVLPKRWIVERTLAWLGRCRRLAKDWEPQPQGARLPPPRLHPPHAAKAMQSSMMFPDRL
jgi:transposase